MKLTIAALVAAVFTVACAGPDIRGPFRNQYIDVDTGKPIQGVVFLAVWEKVYPTVTGDGGRYFYEAREAVSGPDGRVEIPPLSGLHSRFILEVGFRSFAPGYTYADEGQRITESGGQPLIDPTVTRLRRATEEQRCELLLFASAMVPVAATERSPHYVAAVQREQTSLKCR